MLSSPHHHPLPLINTTVSGTGRLRRSLPRRRTTISFGACMCQEDLCTLPCLCTQTPTSPASREAFCLVIVAPEHVKILATKQLMDWAGLEMWLQDASP